jgi:hypothetical protein
MQTLSNVEVKRLHYNSSIVNIKVEVNYEKDPFITR